MGQTVRLTFPLVLVALVAACSADDADIVAPATTTSAVESVTSLVPSSRPTSGPGGSETTIEQEIVDRYKAFWAARLEANQPPVNPDHPGLREYATGTQLENVMAETRQRRELGLAFRLPESSVSNRRVRVQSVAEEEAVLQDCSTSDGIVYRLDTGEIIDDSVATRSVKATMRLVEDEWKLATTQVVQEWKGVAGCALSEDF